MIRMKGNKHGFSLMELMIVVSVIIVLLAIAIPMILQWVPNMRLRSTAQDLLGDMQRAKTTAIKQNSNVVFNFAFNPNAAAADGTCTGGAYTFIDGGGNTVASKNFANTNICLSSASDPNLTPPIALVAPVPVDFIATDGFTARGTPINLGNKAIAVTDNSTRSAPVYVITQTISGGLALDRY